MHVCDAHSVQLKLPKISLNVPFLQGAVPIAPGVMIYGEVGMHFGVVPEIDLQLGPCDLHRTTIALHPLTLGGAASGGFDLTIAAGLGGEARAGIYGEVGVEVIWPDPPIFVKVPVANLQAGIAGFARGIIADHISRDFSASAGITGFSFSDSQTHDLGFALDFGLAGYGALTVLGMNLCTLYWPLYKAHKDATLSLGFGFDLDVGATKFPSLSVDADKPEWGRLSWADLGIELQRDMFKDDCPLCDFLRSLGLMPSQRGGPWPFHPTPAWPGPLPNVYPVDPKDKLKAWHGGKCRGACGLDCSNCKDIGDVFVCEQVGDRHRFWRYPHFNICPTHQGCRDHDACYDWCANKHYERGLLGVIFGPCHRMCDFECACDHSLPDCVHWIFGKGGNDHMFFSEEPKEAGGCFGPCPHKKGAGDDWQMCLPTLELFPRKTVAAPPLDERTGQHTIWSKDVWIPHVGLVTLEIHGSGNLHGDLSAGLGPGTINNICFNVNPHTGTYKGRGEVRMPVDFLARLTASAELGAHAKWFGIVKVISAKGTLEATGKLAGKATPVLSGQVELSCRSGKPTLESDLNIPGCLDLQFDLNAGFDIEAIGFTVFSKKWKLVSSKWDKCWGEDVMLKHTGKDPKIDLRDHTISLTDLLKWLLADKPQQKPPQPQLPGPKREVKESPLTTATAKTVPELAPKLDQTIHTPGTVTLNSGASNTAGVQMMTSFLTFEHSPGSENTSKAQKNIYGFRKLPTRGAGAGNGFSDREYIKGHLLNGKLGGLAEDQNLFPVTAAANHNHSAKVEKKVKELVRDQRLVAMYGVRVTGGNNPQDIDVLGDGTCKYESLDAGFDCTFGQYTLYTDNTVELFDVKNEPISSTFDRASFIAGVKAKNCPEK